MTRFLLSLDEAVDVIFAAVAEAKPGETYISRVASARIADVAAALINGRRIETMVTRIRPGEKLHEILVSEEEAHRTITRGNHYVIGPILPELQDPTAAGPFLENEYSSANDLLTRGQVEDLLVRRKLMVDQAELNLEGEFLR